MSLKTLELRNESGVVLYIYTGACAKCGEKHAKKKKKY